MIIRQGRSANLLSRLAAKIENRSQLEELPIRARDHLRSALKQSHRQHLQVLWEVKLLAKQLREINITPILLKGGAYHYKNLPAALGRTLTDIDILVKKEDLRKVENHLFLAGWIREELDDYDKKYYREYTHEIPPLINIQRSTVLDVHHNIFPVLRGLQPDAEQLFAKAEFDSMGVGILHPYDRIIHSATHLFWGGDFDNGLRDLTDLDLLIRDLATHEQNAIEELVRRSYELNLQTPLLLAFRYCKKTLDTPIPTKVFRLFSTNVPPDWKFILFDFVFLKVLVPRHSSAYPRFYRLATLILQIRGHLLKMPVRVLIPHTIRKILVGISKKDKKI